MSKPSAASKNGGDRSTGEAWHTARTKDPGVRKRGKPKAAAVPLPTGRVTKELLDGRLDRSMGFSDFAFQLGLHYRLPGRSETSDSVSSPPKAVRTRRWLVVCAVSAVAWAAASRVVPERHGERVLPTDVIGEWRAVTPPYAGRGITLLRDSVVLHFGDEQASVAFPITSVRRSVQGDTSVFDVRYLQAPRETQLVFAFVNSTVPTLTLRNTAGVVWMRMSADNTHPVLRPRR